MSCWLRKTIPYPSRFFRNSTTQATRPSRPAAISHGQALQFIESIGDIPVQPMTFELFTQAVAISRRFRLSYWDGAILAATRAMGCDAVYSEDMSDRQNYDGLTVINPFTEE